MSASFSLKNLFAKRPSEEMDPSVTQELSLGARTLHSPASRRGSTHGIGAMRSMATRSARTSTGRN